MKEPINKITLKDGSVRYRLVVDIGRDEHGKRKQLTRTFDTRREAREELSRIRHETNLGTYVKSSKEAVDAYLDGYLQGATRGLRASTKRNYEDALRPVRERPGRRGVHRQGDAGRGEQSGGDQESGTHHVRNVSDEYKPGKGRSTHSPMPAQRAGRRVVAAGTAVSCARAGPRPAP